MNRERIRTVRLSMGASLQLGNEIEEATLMFLSQMKPINRNLLTVKPLV